MAFVLPTHPTRRLCLAIIGGVALQSLSLVQNVVPVWAQAGQTASEPNRPAYQIGWAGRFNEDWSALRGVDLGKTDDFWDRLKFIPLTEDGSVWFTLGGQARERAEYFRQFQFGASEPKQSDAYLLSRFRLTADLHVTPYFRMFAEGKSSFALDRELQGGRTTAFVDEFDLLNGFADIVIPFGEQASATLRGGRQELIFGSQRLVGPGDFTQVPRTFDGGEAIVRIADWTITPVWTQVAVVGYSLPVPRLSPRVYLEFDYASGDKKPGGDVGTFNQLFPNAHSFLGYIDYIGRQNVISPNAGLTMTPVHNLTLSLQHYFFWRDSDRDALYNKSGAVLRPGTATTARYVGAEIDLLANYTFTRHILGYAGYSRFFTGEFIRETGPHKDSDFLYAAIQYTF